MQKIINNKTAGQKNIKQKNMPNKSITNRNNLSNKFTMYIVKNIINK